MIYPAKIFATQNGAVYLTKERPMLSEIFLEKESTMLKKIIFLNSKPFSITQLQNNENTTEECKDETEYLMKYSANKAWIKAALKEIESGNVTSMTFDEFKALRQKNSK